MKTRGKGRLVAGGRLVLAFGFLAGLAGCQSLAKGVAEGAAQNQYREAMEAGRMSPAEYQRQKAEIEQAAKQR